jgi:hypothetical protein
MMNYENISLKIIESSMMKCTHTMQHGTMLIMIWIVLHTHYTKQDARLAKCFL